MRSILLPKYGVRRTYVWKIGAKYGLAIGDDPKTVDPGLIWPDFRGAKHNHIRLKPAKLTKRSFKYLLTQQKKQVIILQKLKQRAWLINTTKKKITATTCSLRI